MTKFIVVYNWSYEVTIHEFDTLAEAVNDREMYIDPHQHKIYQLVEETTKYTLPSGEVVEIGKGR